MPVLFVSNILSFGTDGKVHRNAADSNKFKVFASISIMPDL